MHITEKIAVTTEGQPPQVKRRYDEAQTPFDRLCATQAIAPQRREQLERLRDRTNDSTSLHHLI